VFLTVTADEKARQFFNKIQQRTDGRAARFELLPEDLDEMLNSLDRYVDDITLPSIRRELGPDQLKSFKTKNARLKTVSTTPLAVSICVCASMSLGASLVRRSTLDRHILLRADRFG
jgi:hypothetical protein